MLGAFTIVDNFLETEKRFTLDEDGYYDTPPILDNGEEMGLLDELEMLNTLYEENKELKQNEHQLNLSFIEYKQKVQKTLQKQHDKLLQRKRKLSKAIDMQNHDIGTQLLTDKLILIVEIAEDLGVEIK